MINQTIQSLLDNQEKTEPYSLNEKDSKTILQEYSIPTVQEAVAYSEKQALALAEEFGFPVVLKGLGPDLIHKSEKGLVLLDIQNKETLLAAYREMMKKAGSELDGVLVQPQIKGQREFLAGLFRDPQFGPVIVFGLGGILTEALRDISLRLAPLTEIEAREMIGEIRTRRLLQKFRGQADANHTQLINILMGLSQIALDYPQISELDINPLLIDKNGQLWATDALIVVNDSSPKRKKEPSWFSVSKSLNKFLNPQAVAFIGASSKMGKWGHLLPTNTIFGQYRGNIYLVNPKAGSINGRKVYSSISELPEDVDLAIVTIPASQVLPILPELEKKGINHMLLISSGFGETGPQGKILEKELYQEARKTGLVILGPNTMGLCNPHQKFYCTGAVVHPKPGSISMVSQSGNMGVQLLSFAAKQGIGVRSFFGSGNETVLTIEDYIEGLAQDDLTKTMMLYVESVKDGSRFFRSAKEVSQKKPIVLLKGGESQIGFKAASSHTGAMSSDNEVFKAMCKQSGILKVEGPMDLLDLAAAFSSLPLPRGNRVAILTFGGGWGVITADLCEKFGLQVPELSEELLEYFDQLLPAYWSRTNPIDLVGERDVSLAIKTLEAVMDWDGCDAAINLGFLGRLAFVQNYNTALKNISSDYSLEFLQKEDQAIWDFENEFKTVVANLMNKHQKPIFGVRLQFEENDSVVTEVENSKFQPVFYRTPENAVKACAEMYNYYYFKINTASK